MLHFIGSQGLAPILGKRSGDILDCRHAATSQLGCGFSEACSTCGAAKAIDAFLLQGATDSQENRITQHGSGQALDFRVHAAPFPDQGQQELFLFFLTDIADEKRRRILERIFFHDVANLTTGMVGLSRTLCEKELDGEKRGRFLEVLHRSTNRLAAEIEAQRLLSAAEHHELQLKPEACTTLAMLGEVAAVWPHDEGQGGCRVEVDSEAIARTLVTDQRLLLRILGNMTKNAVEASPVDGVVRLGCREAGGASVEFWVHNEGVIPREVQLQIFQRSFSTKGRDRGLGTHSIKLLGERYLRGQVNFTSTPDQGTTFRFTCPLRPPAAASVPPPAGPATTADAMTTEIVITPVPSSQGQPQDLPSSPLFRT
jgi:signal transduction histidine kinase